jgi:hypothetical protein
VTRKSAKRNNGTANLWPLLVNRSGKTLIFDSCKNASNHVHHRLIALASEKSLVHADIDGEKNGS